MSNGTLLLVIGNADGFVLQDSKARCGGFMRNNAGNWAKGYAMHLGLTTELWGSMLSKEVTWDLKYKHIIWRSRNCLAKVWTLTRGELEDFKVTRIYREPNACKVKGYNFPM